MIGVISGANHVRLVALISNLSPGTTSITEIGINSPIFPENFLSCDRSNVFVCGRGIATLLNILIVYYFLNVGIFEIICFNGPDKLFITCDPSKPAINARLNIWFSSPPPLIPS